MWARILSEFNKLREQNRSDAYRTKQRRINENFGILCEVMSPNELLAYADECEKFMGEERGSHGGNALDELSNFLNGQVN